MSHDERWFGTHIREAMCAFFGHRWNYSVERQRICRRCDVRQVCIHVEVGDSRQESPGITVITVGMARDIWVDVSEPE
jgi:hypothetical protein